MVDLNRDGFLDILAASQFDDTIAWHENDGMDPPGFTERIVSTTPDQPLSVFAADLDGDGDLDVLAPSLVDDRVYWFESDGKAIPSFIEHIVSTRVFGARAVFAADLDSDGDLDVLSASQQANEINWHENLGGSPPQFADHSISISVESANAVHAADIDVDGDIDVLAPGFWFENDGARPPRFISHTRPFGTLTITTADLNADGLPDVVSGGRWFENLGPPDYRFSARGAASANQQGMAAGDINGDGHLDFASIGNGQLSWCPSDGADPPRFTDIQITVSVRQGRSVDLGDLDGDGDLDIVSASLFDAKIAWHRNESAPGSAVSPPPGTEFAPRYIIAASAGGARSLDAGDMDGDGDIDLIVARESGRGLEWYRNDGGSPLTFSLQTNDFNVDGGVMVRLSDLDGDGDLDPVTAAIGGPALAWHRNDGENPPSFARLSLTSPTNRVTAIDIFDIDNDGDLDIVGVQGSTLFWQDRLDGEPVDFQTRVIATNLQNGSAVAAADFDGDGDGDTIVGMQNSDEVIWFQNDGETPPSFTRRLIASRFRRISLAQAVDLDGDDDLDMLAATVEGSKVYGFDNLGGPTPLFAERAISMGSSINPLSARAGDIDGDGDLDIVLSSDRWMENAGFNAFQFTDRPLDISSIGTPTDALPADLDGDGDLDIAMISRADGKVAWFENLGARITILREPENQHFRAGQRVTISLEIAGSRPIAFQWFKDGRPLADGGRISGANADALTIADLVAADAGAGAYHCVATNARGSATSRAATLTEVSSGDANDARIVAHTIPSVVAAGRRLPFTVTVRNAGELAWSAPRGYALAVTRDDGGLLTEAGNRIGLGDALQVVAPGETATFAAELVASADPGLYAVELQMIEEFVVFFGEVLALEVQAVDAPVARFAAPSQIVAETDRLAEATIELTAPSILPIDVVYTTEDGTAEAAADYEARLRVARFAPGETSKTIGVLIFDDNIYESDVRETIRIRLIEATNAIADPGEHVIAIDDNEPIPTIRFTTPAPALNVSESAGFVSVPVVASRPSSMAMWASFATASGSAEAGLDFERTSGVVFFAPGVVEQAIRVRLLGDPLDEANESFTIRLDDPVNAVVPPIADRTATVTIVDNDTDALSLKLVETWNALTTRTIEVGPLPELSRGWFGFPGGWVGPGGGAGESVVMGEGARDPLTELHLRAASVGGSMRVQRTTIPDPLAIDATAPLGNALLARIDPPIDDDAVTSVGIELRWFVGALTPDGTADFPVPGGEALAPLSTLTVSLGAAAADVGEAPLSLPGSIAGRSSLAFRINNDRTGDGGARPRLEFAVNDATFGDLDGLFMLGHRLNVGAAAAPEGIGEALQGPLAANEGEEYIVRVEFRKLGFSETEIAYEVEAVDGEGTLATDGKRRLTVPAAFPPVRAIDELAIVFGAAIGFGDGPGGAIDDAIDAGEQGSWIDDIRVTTFGAQSPPRLSARHWTIYR